MDREQARQTIRERISCKDYLEKSKSGNYCCPFCNSGKGKNHTGALKLYKSNTWTCHACKKSGDVIDLYRLQTGADYNTALSLMADEIGITIDEYRPAATTPPQRGQTAPQSRETETGINNAANDEKTPQGDAGEPQADYTAYYKECRERLSDPAAVEYLTSRGISIDTAKHYWLGFDPQADPASAPGGSGQKYHPCPRLIIPSSKGHYVGRRIDGAADFAKINAKGSTPGIFNNKALYAHEVQEVFIVEGAFDALSILEAGFTAVALNSAGNANILLDQLEKQKTAATLILCPDNDSDPKTAETVKKEFADLAAGLQRLNIPYLMADINNGSKDANEALTSDRAAFIGVVTAIAKQMRYPGLLTAERAIATLEAVDEHYLELPHFPQLAKTLKLKTHDTVVVAADTGAGKSSLSLNILHDLQDKYPAIYFNLEMDAATVLQRLIAIHTGAELDRIEGYKHDPDTRAEVNAAIAEITARKEIQLLEDIYDLKQIEEHIQAATRGRKEPTIVFIDTGLLVTLQNKSASRYERFTQISEELRRISRLNNIIMFVLLQQNREGKKEEQKPPTNSSLKESGSWENDATKILFLWYNPKTRRKELAITKNRSGKIGSITLEYSPHTQTYKEDKNTGVDDIGGEWEDQTIEWDKLGNSKPIRI